MSSNIRLLQLHSRLETLKTDAVSHEQLYAEKHSLLPLSPKPSLAVEEHTRLPVSQKSKLYFSPKIRKIAGSIQSNTLAISAAAVFLLSLFLGNTLLVKRTTPSAQAAISSISEVRSVNESGFSAQKSDRIQEIYKQVAEKNNYGEELFKAMDISRKVAMKVNGDVIALGVGRDVEYETYSVLPGQKGNSVFTTKNQDIAKKLSGLVPGSKIEVQVGEGATTELYKYVYISNNQYPYGDANVFTSSQKSILNLIVLNKSDVYNSFQFRLIGID